MADEKPSNPMDAMFTQRIKDAEVQLRTAHADLFPGGEPEPPAQEPPPADQPPVEEPAQSTPTPTEPPPVEKSSPVAAPAVPPQPAQPPAAPQAGAAAPPPAPAAEGDFPWKDYRRLRKLAEQMEQQRPTPAPAPTPQAPFAAPQQQPPVEPDIDDPLGIRAMVRAELQPLTQRQELERQAAQQQLQQTQQQQEMLRLQAEENNFRQTHTDYDPAVEFLLKSEREEFINSGAVDVRAAQIINTPQLQQAVERVIDQMLINPAPEVVNQLRAGVDERIVAARLMATDWHLMDRRNLVMQGAWRNNKTVPEVAYNLARSRGWQTPQLPAESPAGAPAPAAAANGNGVPPQSVADKIRAEARKSAAGRTLSAGQTNPALGQPTQINTLQEWISFRSRDPEGARAYMARMSVLDPNWHHRLTPG